MGYGLLLARPNPQVESWSVPLLNTRSVGEESVMTQVAPLTRHLHPQSQPSLTMRVVSTNNLRLWPTQWLKAYAAASPMPSRLVSYRE
jgi:hypothetical protein